MSLKTQKSLKFARSLQISTEGIGAVGDLVSKHLNGGWPRISACMWVRYESTVPLEVRTLIGCSRLDFCRCTEIRFNNPTILGNVHTF